MEITTRQAATFRAAIECWKEEMAEGGEWIQESLFFANHSPLSIAEIDELSERLDAVIGKGRKMQETRLSVPTYNYQLYPKYVVNGEKPEFGGPETPVVIREAQGVRIVLGTYDYDDSSKPDIQIERHPNGWMIFLHPLGGSDASGYVYFVDDGRSYLLREFGYGPTPQIRVLEPGSQLPEFDGAS